jgi:hypothetical protein
MKKTSLSGFDPMTAATNAKNKAANGVVSAQEQKSEESVGNGVVLRKEDWKFLRRVAEARVDKQGGRGRPSVSQVIQTLIDENRESLQAEIQ